MSEVASIVVIGAGQAGASAIETLRSQGYQGRLALVGDEPLLPYQRPPLSKKYLLGETGADNLLLLPNDYYTSQNVDLHLGMKVESIDLTEKVLRLSDNSELAWDRLLLATGSSPRTLSPEIANAFDAIHTIRTVRDVDHLQSRFTAAGRVLIVGGGYIGLEVAAIARQRGLETSVIEAAPRILQRVAAEQTSRFFAELHRRNGVDLREGVSLAALLPQTGGRCRVQLSDASQLDVDFIVAGIGVDPATGLAEAAGLEIENGIAVNQFCQTSDGNVFAAGDCASFPWRGQRIRLESVQNAIEQGKTAAMNMLGQAVEYDPVPWFWSDQYDVKLQIAGLNHGYDQTVERAGVRAGSSSLWYFKDGEFLAVDAFNDAPAFMVAKQFLASGFSPEIDAIQDPATNLKQLLRAANRAA